MSLFLSAPIGLMAVGMLAISLMTAEIGFRCGRRGERGEHNAVERAAANAIKGAILGLAGLLLAFSYSLASQRFELRNQVVLRETNAIGTCWLRTDFLDEPAQSQARQILRSIVDTRLSMLGSGAELTEYLRLHRQLASQMSELWKIISAEFRGAAMPFRLMPLMQSANEVIDANGARASTMENLVPVPILAVLALSILITIFMMGHWSGQGQRREISLWLTMITLSVLIFSMIVDLDRPGRGLIQVSHRAFDELRDEIRVK